MVFLNKIPKRSDKLAWRVIAGELVVIPLQNPIEEKLEIFNETATKVWELCDGKHTLRQITKELEKEYAVEGEEIKSSLNKLIIDMLEKRLITI